MNEMFVVYHRIHLIFAIVISIFAIISLYSPCSSPYSRMHLHIHHCIFHFSRLYTTVLTTLTVLLDSIESTLSDARARIKPDEVSSTYFKMAKKQMDTTNVCQIISLPLSGLRSSEHLTLTRGCFEDTVKPFFCLGNGS